MSGLITLQATSVNSGTTVNLPGSVITYAWSNFTNTKPIPGKWGIVESHVAGFENPKMTIVGTIDAGNIPTNDLSQTLLRNFAKVQFDGTTTTAIKLVIASGGDGTTEVYLKDNTDTYDYMYVVIDGFNITFDTNVTDERRWNYTIQLTETSTR